MRMVVCTSRLTILWKIQHTLYRRLSCCRLTLKEKRLLKTQLSDGYFLTDIRFYDLYMHDNWLGLVHAFVYPILVACG